MQLFKGYDRAKYNLQDPSSRWAMQRDVQLHEQALATVARHLSTKVQPTKGAQTPRVLLPPAQMPELTGQVPHTMQAFASSELSHPWFMQQRKKF